NKIHGKWDHKIYAVWRDMKQRCLNPNNQQFDNYGGRGIEIYEDWMVAKHFIEWAKNNGYKDGLSIDRIDVNGNYEPRNCRWVSMSVQRNNKGTNRVIEYDGKRKTIKEWSRKTGVNHETIRRRLGDGWNTKDAPYMRSQQ